EVLADDLLRRVSLEPLGADVPSLDAAGRIEHVDRVVGNAIDQSPKALLAQTQLLIGVLPVGDVSRDLQVALHLTGRVANDRDHDVRPKARAVLSHAPAFVLEATRPRGELELVLRPSRYHRLPRVEAREVLADDLVGGIALDPFRADVPRPHVPARIEEEDGVIAHARDELRETHVILESQYVSLGRGDVRVGCGRLRWKRFPSQAPELPCHPLKHSISTQA